jgi:isoquinoline 1-oxidoreductase alpha subunit
VPAYTLTVNGRKSIVDADADTPLLWILRDHLRLTGTKYGCGIGLCGACTVHEGKAPVRSCSVAISNANGKSYTTIEGLAGNHPCQAAWLEEEVAQCGYCQPGMIMEAAALLAAGKPTDAQITEAIESHICRCGTYPRIIKAIRRASESRKA